MLICALWTRFIMHMHILRYMRMLQVHDDISRLNALAELNLMNNNISSLPAKLGLLSEKLRVLMLEGNPLRSIRRPILEKGSAAVLTYLRGRIPSS